MEYSKKRFTDNVYALAKKRKMKIGDLEKNCHVSSGYLARLRQDEKNTAPGADFLMNVASQLSVSVDSLLSFDFTEATDPELKILNYVEKLLHETEAGKLVWRVDRSGSSASVPVKSDGTSAHPLFVAINEGLLTEEEKAEMELPDSVSSFELAYRSLFRPDCVDLVPAAMFRCSFPGRRVLYLVAVAKPGRVLPGPAQWSELELVMAGRDFSEPVPLAHTDHETPGRLDALIARLFEAVKDVVSAPQLSPEASAIMDDFLK